MQLKFTCPGSELKLPLVRDRDPATPTSDDAVIKHELCRYLYVDCSLKRVQRAIALRFPACANPRGVADGRLDRLQLCTAIDPPTVAMDAVRLSGALRRAASRGDTAVLHWLFARPDVWGLYEFVRMAMSAALIGAASHGDVAFCDWWQTATLWLTRIRVRDAMGAALDAAAQGGHTAVIEWWIRGGFSVAKITSWSVRAAAKHGRVDVLEWFVQQGLPIRQYNDAMDVAQVDALD
ncbi:hypothetical protein AMAG_18999 [Allomyces macrogynus ATCC 38327]|uniref:Ankyrin repeat domain containing protein n=1 Tax=Allomyces macrogynus (strain ATCC 38327) TaxID=578462 RepID=A0A0L0SLQ9_ALLM3|nr:hypothetical protein AMAG_18999 [Allomyces macrogynus ATCC 38327]|eukprot:KNE63398.1 hypothetical protein AMAG_18999 [Allomyces macrogynus ATCC 38327]